MHAHQGLWVSQVCIGGDWCFAIVQVLSRFSSKVGVLVDENAMSLCPFTTLFSVISFCVNVLYSKLVCVTLIKNNIV